MISGKATIAGSRSLLDKLTRMPAAVKAGVRDEMELAAEEVVGMMRRLARNPKLVASIGWRWGKRAPKGSMSVGTMGEGDMVITIFAGNKDVFWAHWWEFGTAERFLKSGQPTGAMPRSPFFFVSWRAGKTPAKRRINRRIREETRRSLGA